MEEKNKTVLPPWKNSDSSFFYSKQIVYWKLDEGKWYTVDEIKEQIGLLDGLTCNDGHGLLISAVHNAVLSLECMELLFSQEKPSRKAIAIVTGDNLATFMMVNFFVKTSHFGRVVKLFRTEEMAHAWLLAEVGSSENKTDNA